MTSFSRKLRNKGRGDDGKHVRFYRYLWPALLEHWLRGRGLLTIDPTVKAEMEAARAAREQQRGKK